MILATAPLCLEWITSMALAVAIGWYLSLRSSHSRNLELVERPIRLLLDAQQTIAKQKDAQILALTRQNDALQAQLLDSERGKVEQERREALSVSSLASENETLRRALHDLGQQRLEQEERVTETALSLASQNENLQNTVTELHRQNETLTARAQTYLERVQQRERQYEVIEDRAMKDREELADQYMGKILELEDKLSEYHRLRIHDCPWCSGSVPIATFKSKLSSTTTDKGLRLTPDLLHPLPTSYSVPQW